MRGISGVVALVLGLAALFGAIGLQTVWAPPTALTAGTDTAAVDAPAEAPLTVITGGINEVVDSSAGEAVEYTLTGEGDYTVMLGQTRDVEAWIGQAAHNTVTGIETEVPDGQDPRVVVEHTEGEATVPNPSGSDLWVDLQEASGTIEQRWSVPAEGDWSLLVASDGTEPAPMEMTVTWTNTVGDSPWIVPLFIIGSLLILVGLGLIAWALLRRRRGSGSGGANPGGRPGEPGAPVRPAAAPGVVPKGTGGPEGPSGAGGSGAVRTRVAGAAVAVLTLAGLAGAGPAAADSASPAASDAASDAPSAEAPTGTGQDQYPIITDSQLERILGSISSTVEDGDAAQDVATLVPRVADQALAMRESHYENLAVSDEEGPAEPVAASPVRSVMAVSDPAFPRTVVAVTQGEGNQTPQVLVLRQESAREQYKLVSTASMVAAATLPASDLSSAGVETVGLRDGAGLIMEPAEAIEGLARYMNDPDHEFGEQFAHHARIDDIHDYQERLEADAPDIELSQSRSTVQGYTTTVRMPDGSALLVVHYDARSRLAPAEEGATVVVDELVAARGGRDSRETTSPVTMTYREVVALRIPAEGSTGDDAKVSLVGMTDELHTVTFE